jgi:hypothetical protein
MQPLSPAHAGFVIDQSNDQLGVNLRNNIQFLGPIGQSFTPTLPALDVVELMTTDFGLFNGMGANLSVNIRAGSLSGSVLGTSGVVSLPDGFNGLTHFDFSAPVGLVPGQTYVIEIVVQSGDVWAVGITDGFPNDPYSRGALLHGQQASPFADLWFREGVTVVPAPSGLALAAGGGLVFMVLGLGRRFTETKSRPIEKAAM